VANILAFQPDERIAQVMQIKDYAVAPYLVLSTANGQVKKTRLTDFDSPRSGGVIAINLREGDELVAAALIDPEQDLLLVTKKAMSIRFRADDDQLRPMGRATEGVRGISLTGDDRLLAMMVVEEGIDVLVATERGFAKRTGIENYPAQGRGGKGVLTADPKARKGNLVGALAVTLGDELYAITSGGGVIRTPVNGVRHNKDRATMGVKLMNLPEDVSIVAIARTTDNDEPEA
jgi:DNA gyrase subunit A